MLAKISKKNWVKKAVIITKTPKTIIENGIRFSVLFKDVLNISAIITFVKKQMIKFLF